MNDTLKTPALPEALLADLDAGVFIQKVGRALSDAALGAVTHGGKGEVTVKFVMKRVGESTQVVCVHSIRASSPTQRGKVIEENATSTPLHVGARGALSLFPEHQPGLFAES